MSSNEQYPTRHLLVSAGSTSLDETDRRIADLLKESMDRSVADMHAIIAKQMFASDGVARPPAVPLTYWQRLRNRLNPIRWYFATLWLAIKGADLVIASDDDDY